MDIRFSANNLVVQRGGEILSYPIIRKGRSSYYCEYKHKLLQLKNDYPEKLRLYIRDGHWVASYHYRNGRLAFDIPLTAQEQNSPANNRDLLYNAINCEVSQAIAVSLTNINDVVS